MSLGKDYYNPKYSTGYASVANLVKASTTTKADVEEWLSGENTYNLHKPFRKRFPRNPYTVTNIDDILEIDVAVCSSISKYNDKFKYYLNAIDIFSQYAWSIPIKDKNGTSITT